MISPEHRVAVVTGSAGAVTRFGDDVVVVGGRGSVVAGVMAELGSTDVSSGSELARKLRMVRDVDVAAVVHTLEGIDIVTVGNGLVSTDDGRPVDTSSPVLWVGIGPVPSDANGRLDAAPHLDLRSGSVPGQGAFVAAPVDLETPAPSFEVADLQAPTDPRAPLPVIDGPPIEPPASPPQRATTEGTEVLGIRCSREHFNNPKAAYCQVCGISMVHITHYLVPGPRPTLGFLVFDDGATFALDRSYCIGREPVPDPSKDLSPLALHDERHSVSRSHAELVLDGWDLVVHDLGSTNGTFVWDDQNQAWTPVLPGQPVTVEPGASVAIGRKVFVYEAVARSM